MSQPTMDEWRGEVRQWLATNLEPRRAAGTTGHAAADLAVFHNLPDEEERRLLDRCRGYQRARYDAGYQALTLPRENGGPGLTAAHAAVFAEEESAFDVPPSTELISVTVRLVAMAVSLFGTPEQRETHARAFLRTDLLACQLFSEPGAGSDLAALRTRARREEGGSSSPGRAGSGGDWVIDGQKVWTSGAQFADHGLLLARTDPDVVKQAGITAFLVPMDSPGVEIRPIRQMSGGASFNEVFLGGVRVPDALRIGRPGQGWEVANATLAFERTASGSGNRRKGGTFDDVLALARSLHRTGDPLVRQRLADLYVRGALRAATVERVARASAAGGRPGPEASLTKLMASELLTRTGQVAAELMGARITADTGEPGTFAWTEHLLGAPGYRLAGGTDQIQRNLIGERVLKLPGEPRVDKVPFSELSGN